MTSRYFRRRRDFGNKKMMENAEARQKVNAEIQGRCMDEEIKHIEDLDYRAIELRVLAEQARKDDLQAEMYAKTGVPFGLLAQKYGVGAFPDALKGAVVIDSLDCLGSDAGMAVKYGIDRLHPMTPVVIDTETGWREGEIPSAHDINDYYNRRCTYLGIDWAKAGSDMTGYTVVKGIQLDKDMTGAKLREIANEFKNKAGLDISIEPFKSSMENRFDHMLSDMAKSALLKAQTKWKYQDFNDLTNTQRHCVEQLLAKGKDRQAEQEFMEAYKRMWITDPLKQGMENLISELNKLNSNPRYIIKPVDEPVMGCRIPTYEPTCEVKLDVLPPLEDREVHFKVVKSRKRRDDLMPLCFGMDMASLMYQPIQGRVALTPEPTASDLISIHALGDEPRMSKRTMNNMNGAKLNGTPSRRWAVILGDFENPECFMWTYGVNPDEAIVSWAMNTGRFNSALDVDKRTFHTMKISVFSPKQLKKEAKRHEQHDRGICRSSTETE